MEQTNGSVAFGSAGEIQNHLRCHAVTARLLWNRGFRTRDALEDLLKLELTNLPDPFSLMDMDAAVERAVSAIINGEKIAVYGDYDVDGTCGTAILTEFFRAVGCQPLVYQPNRFSEGYGVHSGALDKLIDDGATLIVTVDCGITANEPAKLAHDRGVGLIIIDHHKLGVELPKATAVVDPQRPEDESGLKNLCGAGLAFFFCVAVRSVLRDQEYFISGRVEPNLMRLLDLVAVATIADMVDIRGVNRLLVSHGLRVMWQKPRPGLRAILEANRIEKPRPMHCGFVIGPRLNAAGRLKSARTAFELLTSDDPDVARRLASELEKINSARREAQESAYVQAREQALAVLKDPRWAKIARTLEQVSVGPWPRALVLATPETAEGSNEAGWHEGVVGIVATKIAEEFGRPTFILSAREGEKGLLKGSVRSWGTIDILAAISATGVGEHLVDYGGHAHAGGVTLERVKFDTFVEALNRYLAAATDASHFEHERHYDDEVLLSEIDGTLVDELGKLEPFGHGFPEPVLKLSNVSARDIQVLKEKHLKMKFVGTTAFEGVWFNAFREPGLTDQLPRIRAGDACRLWVSPQWNEWQGVRKLQLQIKHAEVM